MIILKIERKQNQGFLRLAHHIEVNVSSALLYGCHVFDLQNKH